MVSISSSDPKISKPEHKIIKSIGKIEDNTNIESWTIEIMYNCNKENRGEVDIIMTVSPDHCMPFSLYWKKNCRQATLKPSINIGITPKGNEVVKKGITEKGVVDFSAADSNKKLVLGKEMHSISFYLSSAEQGVK